MITSTNNVANKILPNNIYNKIFHASSHLDSTRSKELKWGYKLNPKLFSGLHNTVISINKFKTPFWPVFHQSNPGLPHLVDNGVISNGFLNNDEVSEDLTNKTIAHDVDNGIRLDGLYNFAPSGNSFPLTKLPVTVEQNSKNFVFRLGNWIYLGKNKNDVFVQEGYFRK